uniref:centromere protein Q n=1 Tax=Jaculus jaculus TaxID=51337 RepID=UPI001E1B513A|nr:centromere protein Q [Jaculus jaculus]XP_045012889.1 centromere protein Q [Jaculus jaculus]XP_045012890.1 centromere protein Q [Jaculus jaculus]
MSGKASASKKKSQPLKRNSKRRADEEVERSDKEVRNTAKRSKKHSPQLPSEEIGHTEHNGLKQIKIAPSKWKAWQPLPKSTKEHLQSVMESAIIGILSKNIKEKEQIQYHLNYLKKRLLQQCDTLKAPPRKLNYLTNVSNVLKTAQAQKRANEEGLALLQEEIDKLVENTELVTGTIQSLKSKIQILTHEVEEEEEKMKQVLQMDGNRVLSLPELSQKSLNAPTLQEEILKLIPNQNALLKDLDILHSSSPVKNLSVFIEEAYKKLDVS